MSYATLGLAVMENAAHDFKKHVNKIKTYDTLLKRELDTEKREQIMRHIYASEREIYLVFDFLLDPKSNKQLFAPELDGRDVVIKMLEMIPKKYRKGCLKKYANP